jgi:hypothetical protein
MHKWLPTWLLVWRPHEIPARSTVARPGAGRCVAQLWVDGSTGSRGSAMASGRCRRACGTAGTSQPHGIQHDPLRLGRRVHWCAKENSIWVLGSATRARRKAFKEWRTIRSSPAERCSGGGSTRATVKMNKPWGSVCARKGRALVRDSSPTATKSSSARQTELHGDETREVRTG